ncbi:MAG: NAD-binding oxidoreductase, partial [Rhizobiaceae bacterium]
MRFFSYRDRPVHLGPFPLERLRRSQEAPAIDRLPEMEPLSFHSDDPQSLTHAMARFMGMFDTVRDGAIVHGEAEVPADPGERTRHLKAAGYYFDASMVGIARLEDGHFLAQPFRNPVIEQIKEELEAGQPKSYAAGVDMIYADILESART